MVLPTFAVWAATFGKVYNNNEESVLRETIYNANAAEIEEHNAKDLSWTMEVNQFTDLTEEEFLAQYTGRKPADYLDDDANLGEHEYNGEPLADEIDWTTKGGVTPVKNQGQCGSCWAFGTTGSLEGRWFVHSGKLISLSEQQFLDCDKSNGGCNGGLETKAIRYASKTGVCSESDYPYKGRASSCQSSCTKVFPAGAFSGYKTVSGKETGLMAAVQGGPVNLGVDASGMKNAGKGVLTNCPGSSINHAVLLVGYGTDGGKDYWKIKNSWGSRWGEGGYVRTSRSGNQCGMFREAPVYPVTDGSVLVVADEWDAWKQEHGKVYNGDEEDAYRRSVFEANMARIPELQKENPYAEFGATYLSDLTDEELPVGYIPSDVEMPEIPLGNVTVADSQDWTDKCCTPVKDQKSCGSCWAFSAVEQIESMYTLKNQKTIVLAPQELVDCKGDKSQRNGCGGGNVPTAFNVIKQLGGICAETDYPYTAKNGRCSFKESTVKVKVLSHGSVSSESKMKDYVGSTAPLSICHQTGGWSSYKSGVMTSCGSGGGHCTQIVGYGEGNGMTYWKVRNSWGTRFGEAGHLRIQYGKGLCGIKAGMTVDVGSADGSVLV